MSEIANPGTIYQRADGIWCAVINLGTVNGKRKRKTLSSMRREVVEEKLIALTGSLTRPAAKTRAEYMKEARAIATHTTAEWTAKMRTHSKLCRYCDTELNGFNMVKDHMIAVEAGGSDGIDNVQPICWECNIAKGRTPHDEYVYTGTKPRPFRIFPIRRAMHANMMASRLAMRAKNE